jgi:hypothetical protein
VFRIERSADEWNTWDLMMCSPHRVTVDDLHGPPEDLHNQFPPTTSPGNKSAFSGKKGWQARVRWHDSVIEIYEWDMIPVNEFDPETDTVWGWKMIYDNRRSIPAEKLYPLSFIG